MCGIAGALVAEPGQLDLRAAVEQAQVKLMHRGPDDHGLFAPDHGKCVLTHTRLSILDLSHAGHQPMATPDGRFWIVFNGEIYNFRQLRQQLEAMGETFVSQSDTEVLLRLYVRRGSAGFSDLRGMFAFAIWDNQQEELLLARDHFGIKPLYYYATNGLLVFASEVRALLASGLIPSQLDSESVASYLRFGCVESPLTIIKDVRSLVPGHCLTVKCQSNGLQVEEVDYANSLFNESSHLEISDRREAVDRLREVLKESIQLHLVSDVPLAAFLSGGIDSSVIVALMSQVAEERPKTFTVIFSEEEFSERTYARLIAKRFDTDHQEIFLSETSLLQMLPDALMAMDQPTIDGINNYVISKAVKESGVTVALSGLGGDELFAGYPSFRRVQKLQRLGMIPAPLRKATAWAGQAVFGSSVQQRKAWHLLAGGGTPRSAYTISRQLFSWEEVAALINKNRNGVAISSPAESGFAVETADPVNAVSRYELQGYMANMLLRDADQMSMAHSLELRVPFIDPVVVAYVLGLPGKWKVDGSQPKPLLVDAVGDLLPHEIWRRPKMGFTLPFDRWMHSALKSNLSETFNDSDGLADLGLSDFGRTVWNTFENSPRKERWSRPWAIHVLKRWCDINGVRL